VPCCAERTKADVPGGVIAPVQYGPRAAALGTYLWLRELTAVTETAAADDVIWARQAIDALLELKKAKLQCKRHALATRMLARRDDYLRFAHHLRVPF